MKINKTILLLLWFVIATAAFLWPRNDDNTNGDVAAPSIPTDTLLIERYTPDWDAFIEALIHVESRGDSVAVGTRNDVGVLQITPIMINDANRIIGEPRYALDDRTDRDKSIEIFNIIQNHYNPDHDLHFALKIWNSKAPVSYHRAVMEEYNRLTTTQTWN